MGVQSLGDHVFAARDARVTRQRIWNEAIEAAAKAAKKWAKARSDEDVADAIKALKLDDRYVMYG